MADSTRRLIRRQHNSCLNVYRLNNRQSLTSILSLVEGEI